MKPGGGGPPGSSGSPPDSDEDDGDGGGGPFRVDAPHAVSVGIGSGFLQWNERRFIGRKTCL